MQIFVGGADTKLVANKSVTQKFEQLTPSEKPERLMKVIMEQPADAKIVVFCNTKADCAKLEADQKRLGRGTCAIHGDKDQWERERALHAFASGRAPIMFATDVAARGLDVRGVTLVINYDLPQGDDGVENYVHRIGRTGRAGTSGIAITECMLIASPIRSVRDRLHVLPGGRSPSPFLTECMLIASPIRCVRDRHHVLERPRR